MVGTLLLSSHQVAPAQAAPVGTAFSYQGQLKDAGSPASGTYDLQFKLFDAAIFGTQKGATIQLDNVAVSDGLFTVSLDFGAQFTGDARWLEIGVHPGSQPVGNPYTILSPRQPLSATPYALGLRLPFDGTISAVNDAAIQVNNTATTGLSLGLRADTYSPTGYGVFGGAQVATGTAIGVRGSCGSPDGFGIYGDNDNGIAVYGISVAGYGAWGESTSGTGVVGNSTSGIGVTGDSDSLTGVYGTSNSGTGVFGTSSTGRAGLFRILNSGSSVNAVEISTNGNSSSQALYAQHSGLGDCGLFQITNASNTGEAIEARTNGTGDAVQAVNTGTGRAGYFAVSNASSAAPALYCSTTGTGLAFHANGRARVNILEIVGADVAERFPVSDRPEPGMVMEIDPDHPGKLRVARGEYSRRVAGIVSGANGFSVGAVLGNSPSSGGGPPIALSGRVYCLCDAEGGAIRPGDLLTTAARPGHAMKVSDHSRAQGAILGKAMTAMQEGRGLVLVLVSLQ
jgi:hypothetical protein